MPPRNPVEAWNRAPLEDMLKILLGQFTRLLAAHKVELTDDEVKTLAWQIAASEVEPAMVEKLRAALMTIISESEAVLKRWNFTFAQSLAASMDNISGWETTAEFLEIANEKTNAELRISAGASLLVALGDMHYAAYLLDIIAYDAGANDVDALIARRVLSFASGIEFGASDWLTQVTDWLKRN